MFTSNVHAQTERGRTDLSLSAYVPDSAGLFIELNKLADRNTPQRVQSARHLYDILVGTTDTQMGVAANWRRVFLERLGIKPGQPMVRLFEHRLAVAAPSWNRLAEGIILVRLNPNDDLLEHIFAPGNINEIRGLGDVTFYTTDTGLSAATDGNVLLLSQRRGDGSMYERAVKIILSDSSDSLLSSRAFRSDLRGLPRRRDGMLYLNPSAGMDGRSDQGVPSDEGESSEQGDSSERAGLSDRGGVAGFMGMERLALSLRLSADRADVTLRGKWINPPDRQGEGVSIDLLKSLPLTTVGAWCTRIDPGKSVLDLLRNSSAAGTPMHLRFFASILDIESLQKTLLDRIGPNAVIAWDQPLSSRGTPELAIILESEDAGMAVDAAADAVQVVVDWFDLRRHNVSGPRLSLSRSEYFGAAIHELSIVDPRTPATESPANGQPSSGASGTMKPAFAAVGDHFVVALSIDHIRNLIDAHMGLIPRLSEVREIKRMTNPSERTSAIAFAQPALATQIVDEWVGDDDGVMSRWLALSLGGSGRNRQPGRGSPQLGIGILRGEQAGSVRVVRVDSGGRADGMLQAGDLVLGVNGKLLALADEKRDLRSRLASPVENGFWSFRVQRDGKTLEVKIPAGPPQTVSDSVRDPAGALRQLQTICRRIEFSSLRIVQSFPDGLTARLSIRFSPESADAVPEVVETPIPARSR